MLSTKTISLVTIVSPCFYVSNLNRLKPKVPLPNNIQKNHFVAGTNRNRSTFGNTLINRSCLITLITIPLIVDNFATRGMRAAASKGAKVIAESGTHLTKSPPPGVPVRSISFNSTQLKLPSGQTKDGSPAIGDYYHPGVLATTCNKAQCSTVNCADSSKSTPNPCGVSVQEHQKGNIPRVSPTGVSMSVEVIGNLTHNASPKGVPATNVVPITKGMDASAKPKDQYLVKENSVVKKPLTGGISKTKVNAYVQKNGVTSTLTSHIPKDSNINDTSNVIP